MLILGLDLKHGYRHENNGHGDLEIHKNEGEKFWCLSVSSSSGIATTWIFVSKTPTKIQVRFYGAYYGHFCWLETTSTLYVTSFVLLVRPRQKKRRRKQILLHTANNG